MIYTTTAKELNPRAAAGTAIGLLNAGAYFGVALLTSAVGIILDAYAGQAVKTSAAVLYPRAAYQSVFALCVLLAAVSCLCAWCVRERTPGAEPTLRG